MPGYSGCNIDRQRILYHTPMTHGAMCCPLQACMRTPWDKPIRSDTADITKILRRASTIYRADTMTPPSEGLLTRIRFYIIAFWGITNMLIATITRLLI